MSCLQKFIVDCLISYFECKSFRVQQYKFPRTYRKKQINCVIPQTLKKKFERKKNVSEYKSREFVAI